MKNTFFDFFPVPELITIPSVGLSLTDDSVFFVKLSPGKSSKFLLKSYGFEKIPYGVIENGDIKSPKELIHILSNFRKQHDLSFIKTSLPDEKSFLFRTNVPKMSLDEIRSALQFKIEENVPLLANEAIFDFQVLPWENPSATELQVVVAVISEEVVFNYINIFKESGFKPVLFDIESQSIVRAIITKNDLRPYVVVNSSENKTAIYIVDRGIVQFTSNLNLGKNLFLSSKFPKSETAKKNNVNDDFPIYVRQDLEEHILKDEVEKLVSYWESFNQKPNLKIEKMVICGSNALDQNLKDYFKKFFSFSIDVANVWTNTFSLDDIIPDMNFEESFKYASSIGLCLPYDHDNLKN